MSHAEAFDLLFEHFKKPIFGVKIGMCSPQVEWTDFEGALKEFSRCFPKYGDTDLIEYVFMYAMDDVAKADQLNIALGMFGLGLGRAHPKEFVP